MPDTTTTNLGLTKPEVGASDDTWGAKINDNWDVLDAAVANVAKAGNNSNGRWVEFDNGFVVMTKLANFAYVNTPTRLEHSFTPSLSDVEVLGVSATFTFSNTSSNFVNCSAADMGAVSMSDTGATFTIQRSSSGVSFPTTARVNNVRLVVFGRRI